MKPGALATSFVVNRMHPLNVSTELRLGRIHAKARAVEFTLRLFAFELESEATITNQTPFFVKEERASFEMPLGSKDEYSRLASAVKAKEGIELLLKAEIKTCAQTLVSLVLLESQDRHHAFLIDVLGKQTVVDLSSRIHGDIPQRLQGSPKVLDAAWVTISGRQSVLLLTLSNGCPVCFDHDGQQVKLLSEGLFSQNILGNVDKFFEAAAINPDLTRQRTMWALSDTCLTLFDGHSFNSFSTAFTQQAH